MAISHELSTEIATALLTGKERTPSELHDLKEMLLEIHSTLERLTETQDDERDANQTDPPRFAKAFGSSV